MIIKIKTAMNLPDKAFVITGENKAAENVSGEEMVEYAKAVFFAMSEHMATSFPFYLHQVTHAFIMSKFANDDEQEEFMNDCAAAAAKYQVGSVSDNHDT